MNQSIISIERTVGQYPGNIVSDMDGEKVMLNLQNGKYYNLGSVGGRIWELVEKPVSVQQVVSRLMLEYDVESEQCGKQVVSFLNHLHAEGLIHCTEGENYGACQ